MKRFSPGIASLALAAVLLPVSTRAFADSYFTRKPDDPTLLVLTKDQFPALHADGITDDSATIQAAINAASSHGNVLLVPEGRFAIANTIGIPPSTRLIGFGATRPAFVLPPHTPGFDTDAPKYMVWFSGGRSRNRGATSRPATGGTNGAVGASFSDASPGTFYSGLSNIDFTIEAGNAAAVAIRGHFAQHGVIAHCDFNIGEAYAGIDGVGNEAEDLHFHGGQYGIVTTGTSPSWQYTLLDSSFDHQKIAAFKTHNTGLTLIRNRFHDVPTAIAIDENQIERLWMKNCSLENLTGPALIIGQEDNVRNELNVEECYCSNVPEMAYYIPTKRHVPSSASERFLIKQFTYGLQIPAIGTVGTIQQTFAAQPLESPPQQTPSDILPLPPMDTWVNLRSFGAVGDGKADDLPAFRAAIASAKPIFLPRGEYRVSDSVTLGPETILIGLNPITTQIVIDDRAPAFISQSDFKGVIEAPRDGRNVVQGVSIDSGANNEHAVGLKWMASEHSMVNDVKFLGGHGTWYPDGRRNGVYNADHSADPNPDRKWNSSGPSLLVSDGGGGTFANIWTASTFSASGMTVENTSTPGHVYELSSEHHVRNEVIFRHVSNWEIAAQQTEEEWGEGPQCLPLQVEGCSDLTFANTILFRVFGMAVPFKTGIQVADSRNVRFLGLHAYGQSPFNFDNSAVDVTSNIAVPSREAALVTISGNPGPQPTPHDSPVVASAAMLRKVGDGYFSADHAIVDSSGNAYFVDLHQNKILRYSAEDERISTLRDDPLQPFALAVDRSQNLIILSRLGKAFSLPLADPHGALTELTATDAKPRPGMSAFLPADRWWDWSRFLETNARREPLDFLSPDQSTFIPVPEDYHTGRQHNWTSQPIDLYRGNQLAPAIPGKIFYVADEYAHQTWSFTATDEGTLTTPHLFAQHGEAGITTDSAGNVYIAEGDIFVYDPAGKLIDTLHTPERPLSLVFAGADRQTLFITTRTAAYTLRMSVKG